MSLAVLARKTRTKQRLKSSKRGFVLNMTNRGGGIGLSGMSYKQRGANCKQSGCCSSVCKTGQASTCCSADKNVSKECRKRCGKCWYNGSSQPAPQMSYRNYINRKASGAYRPGGRPCCNTAESTKNLNVWKQPPNIASSTVTEHRKQSTLMREDNLIHLKQMTCNLEEDEDTCLEFENGVYLVNSVYSDCMNEIMSYTHCWERPQATGKYTHLKKDKCIS